STHGTSGLGSRSPAMSERLRWELMTMAGLMVAVIVVDFGVDRSEAGPNLFDQPVQRLKGRKVAILATDGVEQSALTLPRKALDGEGASTKLISPVAGKIRAWNHKEWGESIAVD